MAKSAPGRKPSAALLKTLERIHREVDHLTNEAQLAFFDAMEADAAADRMKRVAALLAERPLSADAWGLLAAAAPPGSDLAVALWQQAVAAGTLQVGALAMVESVGEFWGWIETRPYMRARLGLAQEYRERGEHAAAIAEAEALLVLNPNDNQGVRYLLLGWLLSAERDDAAAALHKRYIDDDYAGWLLGVALLAFRCDGAESKAAQAALAAVTAANPHVAPLLTGAVALPKRLPGAYTPGEASEAQIAWQEMAPIWASVPGALDWARARLGAGTPPPPRGRRKG